MDFNEKQKREQEKKIYFRSNTKNAKIRKK